MDKRSWPWKKKSSDKQATEKAEAATASESSMPDKVKQETNKKPKYVQISMESYTHLTGLEDQVKSYEDQILTLEDEIKELNKKLSESDSEMTNKENLVKQHAKVAEEAVSGWEKAEAEAATLKNHLESVTLLKLTAEDRATHLDGALKECMRQIRNLKEEHEQKLHEVVLNKAKMFDKMKLELEAKVNNLDQELLRSAAENAALSRSLQEHSNMLIQLTEEKSHANAEIGHLKSEIESCEKDVNSLKYELHIARKEVEIRNEEKNMSVRSADVATKQHLEGVKKIAKLEAECQRLRGLVRKKLPGPAALAQMKLEVESLGRDYGESHLKRSPVKAPEFSFDNANKYLKENELLTDRLLAMDEETKMLKEALAKRNCELQTSRSIYAQTASKLQSLEAQIQANGEQRSPLKSTSFTSLSEDGNDDNVSSSGSLISELSNLKKEKNLDGQRKCESANHVDLMDDFLEMEKLACQSNETGPSAEPALVKHEASVKEDAKVSNLHQELSALVFVKLQSQISHVLELVSNEKDTEEVKEEIRRVMQDMRDSLHHHSVNGLVETSRKLEVAVSQICDYLIMIGEEANTVPGKTSGTDGLNSKISTFSAKYSEDLNSDINLSDFVLDISQVLNKASELHINILRFKTSEVETGNTDCIDKIALPEKKVVVDSLGERYPHFSDSTSDPENEGNLVPTSESTATSWKCSFKEYEQLKMDKDASAVELARSIENLENTKSQLLETETLLAELRSQLTTAQKVNSLAETQLKCMAESYNSLESRSEDLKTEVNLLQGKIVILEKELHEERRSHEEALNRCKDLQEELESVRIDACPAADVDDKTGQGELAAAAEKLAECQETIFLLGKQLNSLRPQTGTLSSPKNQKMETEELTINGGDLQDTDASEVDTFHLHKAGSESPLDIFNASSISPSDSDTNNLLRSPVNAKHNPTKSGSSSASSTPTPEKHARGFSRFFSSKAKTVQ